MQITNRLPRALLALALACLLAALALLVLPVNKPERRYANAELVWKGSGDREA